MNTKTKEVTTQPRVAMTPADLLEIAVNKGTDIDQLEKLMNLQERWEAGEARKAYIAALSQFRADCPTIARTRDAHNSKYAGLAETIETIKEIMSVNGLSHSWKVEQNEQLVSVTCHLTHVGGHSETSTMSASPDTSGSKNNIQAIGSTVAYLERYTFFALLGLASREMDDDGDGATKYITEDQFSKLNALADEVGADKEGFVKFLQVDSLRELPAKKFKGAMAALESKRDQRKKQ